MKKYTQAEVNEAIALTLEGLKKKYTLMSDIPNRYHVLEVEIDQAIKEAKE